MKNLFKSTTGSDILHESSGIVISINYTEVQVSDIAKMFDDQLINGILDGTIVYNDGSIDYDAESTLAKIDWTGNNFNIKTITGTQLVAIPETQQMIVYGDLKIDGNLSLSGDVIINNW